MHRLHQEDQDDDDGQHHLGHEALIAVADAEIAQTLAASIARPNPGAIYNLCDDDPAPPEDVLEHAARLLGLPPPPAE